MRPPILRSIAAAAVWCALLALNVAMVRAQQAAAPGAPVQLTPAEQKAADMRLPDLDRSDLTPDSRQPMKVEEGERNPFGMVTKVLDQMVSAEPVSEERRIRQLLSNLRVAGVSESPTGRRVLLGSLSLGEGDVLPRLFVGQVEKLQVKSINDRGVVLSFIESDTSRDERSIGLPIDIKPRVNSLLIGEAFVKSVPLDEEGSPQLPPLQLDTVRSALEASEAQGLQSLIERRTELLNAPAIPAAAQ
jgi:hypothetical protein